MRSLVVITWVSLVSAGVAVSARQSPQAPVPTFNASVDVVQLDVSVLDKDHQPVRGLTAEDFTVLEDGRPQKLVTLQAFDIPDPVIPKTPWMREVASDVATNRLFNGRLVVVVIDDRSMSRNYWTTATAGRVADTILDQLGPDDLAAVVYTKVNTKAQNFTADRALIRAAIGDIHRGMSIQFERFMGSCDFPASPEVLKLDALLRVSAALQAEPQRRKTILLVSPGFPIFTDGRRPRSVTCELSLYRNLLRDTQRGNINIYGIDPGRPPGGVIAGMNALDDLRTLSESTGGRLILNGKENNPEARVPQIFDENASYYLLGFQSDNSKLDGTFRTLEVKVNRPGVEVRTRSGYYAGKAADRKPPKKPVKPLSPLDESVTGLLPVTTTPLRVSAAPFAIAGKPGATVAIALGVEQPAADVRPNVPMLSVLVNAYDLDGREQASKRTTVDLVRAPGATGQLRYDVLARLDLRPGRYEVRIGTETAAQQRGSVFAYVDVPDFKQDGLWLSGVLFERTPALPATPANALTGVAPIIPTTVREFTPTDRVATFLRVYQGGGRRLSAAQVASRLVNERDETVFEESTTLGVERFASMRSADYRLALPLERLPAGEYFLSIDVTLEKQRERRDVRFVVR